MASTEASSDTASATPSTELGLSIAKSRREFRVKERIFSPDYFDVSELPGGDLAYYVKGKVLSRDGSKTMYDSRDDSRLFKVTENINTWLQKTYMFDYRKKAVYSLRKSGFLPGFGRNVLKVFRGKEEEGGIHFMDILANGIRTKFTFTDVSSSATLATVTRSAFSARRVASGADAYNVTVMPGSDIPFILMLVVCVDEQYNDFNK